MTLLTLLSLTLLIGVCCFYCISCVLSAFNKRNYENDDDDDDELSPPHGANKKNLGFRSLNNSTSKRVLDLLEPVKLIVWMVVIERVAVVKFGMDSGSGNGAGCFEVEIWADTAKFRNVIVAGFRKCRDLMDDVVNCSNV